LTFIKKRTKTKQIQKQTNTDNQYAFSEIYIFSWMNKVELVENDKV